MSVQIAGPIGTSELGQTWIDAGTSSRTRSAVPGSTGVALQSVASMSAAQKIEEAVRRSLPMLGPEARRQVEAMLSPGSLAIMTGTLIVWAGSHFFGVGEIVDIILLAVGFVAIGLGVFSGASELYEFATDAVHANSEEDLNRAARHFAAAVNILGISVISAVLMRRSAGAVKARGRPTVRRMPNVGQTPPAGVKPRITRPYTLPGGALGETDWFGNIAVTRNQTFTEQRLTLYHEWIHSVLSPKTAPLRRLRAQLRASAYWRSSLLRYLEEAMAESYAQLKVQGIREALLAFRFPIQGGYVTVSQLGAEGTAIGTITVGSMVFNVTVVQGDWEQQR